MSEERKDQLSSLGDRLSSLETIKLWSSDGKDEVSTVRNLPWKYPPEVLLWGDRVFVLRPCAYVTTTRQQTKYCEAKGTYWIPPELWVDPPAPTPNRPDSSLPQPSG